MTELETTRADFHRHLKAARFHRRAGRAEAAVRANCKAQAIYSRLAGAGSSPVGLLRELREALDLAQAEHT